MWQDVAKDTPLHVIGKAPELVVLGLGYTDLAAGRTPEEIAQTAHGVITLVLQKTQARIGLLSTVSAFLEEGSARERSSLLNRRMRESAGPRVSFVDLEGRVERFYSEHRQSPGEKHSLHLDSNRLTPLGRLFMAHHAFHLITWPEALSGSADSSGPLPF